jgi:hypothetical protein
MTVEDDGSVLAEVQPVELKPRDNSMMVRREELKRIEQGILTSALEVVSATLDFAAIDPDDALPPKEWVEKYGKEAAMRKFRVAKEGWKSAKEAAVGIKVAAQIASAGIKAHAERVEPRSLNVSLVKIAVSDGQFAEIEVSSDHGSDD